MKALTVALVVLASLIPTVPAVAAESVRVVNAWTRATLPGQKVAGIYVEIMSPMDGKLTGVAFPQARSAELHSMKLENGTMKMRSLNSVDLPAGKWVKLEPNGLHIMAFDLERPLRAGQKLPMMLRVELAGQRPRDVHTTVRVVNSEAASGHDQH
jgi:copper(I)-binding protein